MPKETPSMAKNKMRRALVAVLDPLPTKNEIGQLWDYFGSTCAYCGVLLERGARTAHLDHVVAASDGGTNSIFNHVLSCARCNGDEKREIPWQAFLAEKVQDLTLVERRKRQIEQWLQRQSRADRDGRAVSEQAQQIIDGALAEFDGAVEKLRKIQRDAKMQS